MSRHLLRFFLFTFIFLLSLALSIYLFQNCKIPSIIILASAISFSLFITLIIIGIQLYKSIALAKNDILSAEIYQERYHQLFTNIDRAIIIYRKINNDFFIVDLNNAVEIIENKPKEEIINKPLLEAFPKAKKFGIIELIEEVYSSGKPKDMPVKYYHADHAKGYRENHIFKLKSGEIVSIYKDVTKDIEFKKELILAKKAAEREQELRSKFMSNMSHELRTPLNGIMMANELFSMTGLNYEQQELNQIIVKSSENLLDIINSIIDMTNIDLNQMILHEHKIRLIDVFQNSYFVYENMARQKNIQFFVKTDKISKNYYITDPHRIRQIFMNLIHNAVKFTNRGKVNIYLKKYKGPYNLPREWNREEYDIIEFIVEDTGIGISEDAIDLLYEKFFQIDMSTTKKYGGSGIGLSIAHALLKMMHGNITVESLLDHGSKFTVQIPMKKADAIFENTKNTIDTYLTQKTKNHKSSKAKEIKILIVEDNIINRTLTAKMIQSLGYQSDIASDGQDAVVKIENTKNSYDLILMDIQMPILNGYEASKKIRHLESLHQKERTPIVALTAYVSDYDKEKCFQCGMDDFLSKPIDKNDLSHCLNHFISSKNIN